MPSIRPYFCLSPKPRIPKASDLMSSASSSSSALRRPAVYEVPGLTSSEICRAASDAFARHSTSAAKQRTGAGVAIVWFRNDLRLIDNEVLLQAWASSNVLLPLYCFDPRHFASTDLFRFPKTGALRAKFLLECLHDLKKNLKDRGLDLLIKHGRPEDILPSIAKAYGAHTVFAQKETCCEELQVEKLVLKGLQEVILPQHVPFSPKPMNPKLQLIWGSTMYHIDDLPFDTKSLPDIYTHFRKSVESKSSIRECCKLPVSLGPLPSSSLGEFVGFGSIPSLEDLGLQESKLDKGLHFIGGENAALGRVYEYFWNKDLLRVYKETRNGMVGPNYSTKFSPWLACGSLSPRYLHAEVKRYEKERLANDSTYWVLFELIWRDYFRFISLKYGNSIFHLGGPRKVVAKWSQDKSLFESWKGALTGYPLIDANMKELSMTGFMSNRGRQIVCSFLVRDMGLDWRMGAEWFESCLLDYDPCSNYGNWTYGAGVGNDPREDRYFNIPKQAKTYDPEGEYVSYWLPELQSLPREARNFPGRSYIKQIVPLKFDNTTSRQNRFSREKRRQ